MINQSMSENKYPQNLELIANKIRDSVIAENDDVYQLLTNEVNQSPSLMARLFPSAMQREKQALTVQRVKSLASKKEELMTLYFKVKLEMARQEGDTLIKAAGAHLKTELAIFVTTKIDEMDSAILTSREKVMAKMKPHIDAIEQYKDYPMLYIPAKKSIDSQIVNYMSTIDELLDGFRNSLTSETTRAHHNF